MYRHSSQSSYAKYAHVALSKHALALQSFSMHPYQQAPPYRKTKAEASSPL